MPKSLLDDLTLDDIIHVYMIFATWFDLKTASYIPKFIEEAGIFETIEDAMSHIANELDNGPRIWYSVAPLWVPKELESRELLDCINFDTMIKEKFLGESKEIEIEQNDGAKIISIEDVWEKHGGMPEPSGIPYAED